MKKYFVFKTQPVSYNNRNCSMYQARLQCEFASDSSNAGIVPIAGTDLYANVIYFHQTNAPIDADNLSKPFIDAFQASYMTMIN